MTASMKTSVKDHPARQQNHPVNPFIRTGANVFFQGGQRSQILDYLPHLGHYGHYLVLITGLPGSGKTCLKQQIEFKADSSLNRVFSLKPSDLNGLDELGFLCLIARHLDISATFNHVDELKGIITANVREITERGCQVVCLVDDADQLTELALLQIFELLVDNDNKSLQFVLFSKPGLLVGLSRVSWGKYFEEYGHHIALTNLSHEETEDYLKFCLNSQGFTDVRFPAPLVSKIYRESGGIIGSIDRIAAKAFKTMKRNRSNPGVPKAHLMAAAVISLGIGVLLLWGSTDSTSETEHQVIALGDISADNLNDMEQNSQSPVGSELNVQHGSPETSADSGWAKAMIKDEGSTRNIPTSKEVSVPQISFLNSRSEPLDRAAASSDTSQIAAKVSQLNQKHEYAIAEIVEKTPSGDDKTHLDGKIDVNVDSNAEETLSASNVSEKGALDKNIISPSKREAAIKHIQAEKKRLTGLDAKKYTLQLLGGRNEQAVKKFLKVHKDIEGLGYIKTQHKGGDWFVVIQGEYPTRQHAQAAISGLPATVRKKKPWPRRIGDIQ